MPIDNAQDLVTLADAKTYLGIADASQDSLIQDLIGAASQAIADFVNRDLPSASRTETRSGNDKTAMVTLHYPVTAVSSVVVDEVSIPASTGISVSGFYFDDNTIYLRGYSFTCGQANVVLSYTAGFVTVPAAVKRACYYTIQAMKAAPDVDPNIVSESVPGVYSATYRSQGAGIVPVSAQALLNNYIRRFPL